MTNDELNHLEQKLVTLSARRFQRPFYRWGHLLGWLVLPLLALMLIPAMKPYSTWLGWVAILLIFAWYFVLSTRVIGKLQARTAAAPKSPPP